MADRPIRDMSEYPRPWFYRPEVYYGFFIFPPVWSILTLRSPWHNRNEGFRGILVGGIAWFLIIASVVLAVRWVQEGGVVNLFVFVPGLLLTLVTLVTQIQWTAHRARYGPPPGEQEDEQQRATAAAAVQRLWPLRPARTPARRMTRHPVKKGAAAAPTPLADAADAEGGTSAGRRIPARSARIYPNEKSPHPTNTALLEEKSWRCITTAKFASSRSTWAAS